MHDLLNRKDVTSVQAEQLIRMVLQHRFINDNLYTSYIKVKERMKKARGKKKERKKKQRREKIMYFNI